jgi:hypothetical protein
MLLIILFAVATSDDGFSELNHFLKRYQRIWRRDLTKNVVAGNDNRYQMVNGARRSSRILHKVMVEQCGFSLAEFTAQIRRVLGECSQASIYRCQFTRCSSWEDGGGVFFSFVGEIEIRNSVFTECYAFGHGGGVFISRKNPIGASAIQRSTFVGCKCGVSGVALYISGGNIRLSYLDMNTCRISDTRRDSGLFLTPDYDGNCSVLETNLTECDVLGHGAAISLSDSRESTLFQNCIFSNNTGDSIVFVNTKLEEVICQISYCLFEDNSALISLVVVAPFGSLRMENSVFGANDNPGSRPFIAADLARGIDLFNIWINSPSKIIGCTTDGGDIIAWGSSQYVKKSISESNQSSDEPIPPIIPAIPTASPALLSETLLLTPTIAGHSQGVVDEKPDERSDSSSNLTTAALVLSIISIVILILVGLFIGYLVICRRKRKQQEANIEENQQSDEHAGKRTRVRVRKVRKRVVRQRDTERNSPEREKPKRTAYLEDDSSETVENPEESSSEHVDGGIPNAHNIVVEDSRRRGNGHKF